MVRKPFLHRWRYIRDEGEGAWGFVGRSTMAS